MFCVGFQEGAHKDECCYLLPEDNFWLGLASVQEVLLNRKDRRTVVACQNQRVRRIVERVAEEVYCHGDVERRLVLEKIFGISIEDGSKRNTPTNIEVTTKRQIDISNCHYAVDFSAETVTVTNKSSDDTQQTYQFKNSNSKMLEHSPSVDFEILRLGRGSSWSVRTGTAITYVNPTVSTSKLPDQVILTSARYGYLVGLIRLLLVSRTPVKLLTTQIIFWQLMIRFEAILPQISLDNLIIFQELTPSQFLTLCPQVRIRVSYIASLLPAVNLSLYYKGKSIQIYGDWYYYPKDLYFSWKRNDLKEQRYYELINPSMKETLCLVDTNWVQKESLDKFSSQHNIKLFGENLQEQEFKHTIIEKPVLKSISFQDKIRIVNQNGLFKCMLTLEQIYQLVDEAEQETFKASQLIVKKGMKTEKVYFICAGEVQLDYQNEEASQNKTLSQSDILCQYILFSDNKLNTYTAKCSKDVILLSIRKDSFLFTVRSATLSLAKEITNSEFDKTVIESVPLINKIHFDIQKRIFCENKIKKLSQTKTLEQFEKGIALCIVLAGKVKVNQQLEYSTGKAIFLKSTLIKTNPIIIIQAKEDSILLQLTDRWLERLLEVNSCEILSELML